MTVLSLLSWPRIKLKKKELFVKKEASDEISSASIISITIWHLMEWVGGGGERGKEEKNVKNSLWNIELKKSISYLKN